MMHEDNCFVTLTFNDQNLPSDMSLDVRDFQLFMKRMRKAHGKMRFFHCGEYGEKYGRPHYHACIFGFDFADKSLWKVHNGQRYYTSANLKELWPYGYSIIGHVTFASAAYVARYITKKVTGELAETYYDFDVVDSNTGEVTTIKRKPEYTTMSRRPGIGKPWLEKYGYSEIYNGDYVIINGKKVKPPRYYDKMYKSDKPLEFEEILHEREKNAEKHSFDNTPERLKVREKVQSARMNKLKRNLEEDY